MAKYVINCHSFIPMQALSSLSGKCADLATCEATYHWNDWMRIFYSSSVIVMSRNGNMGSLQKAMLYTPVCTSLASHTHLCNDLGNCAYKCMSHCTIQCGTISRKCVWFVRLCYSYENGNIPYEVTTGP